MEEVTVKFFCNAGHTEEEVTIKIYKDCGKTEEQQIEEEFHKWLDNNEDCGWEKFNGIQRFEALRGWELGSTIAKFQYKF